MLPMRINFIAIAQPPIGKHKKTETNCIAETKHKHISSAAKYLPIPSSAALCVQPTASHQSTPASRLHQNLPELSIIKEIQQQQSLWPQASWARLT